MRSRASLLRARSSTRVDLAGAEPFDARETSPARLHDIASSPVGVMQIGAAVAFLDPVFCERVPTQWAGIRRCSYLRARVDRRNVWPPQHTPKAAIEPPRG